MIFYIFRKLAIFTRNLVLLLLVIAALIAFALTLGPVPLNTSLVPLQHLTKLEQLHFQKASLHWPWLEKYLELRLDRVALDTIHSPCVRLRWDIWDLLQGKIRCTQGTIETVQINSVLAQKEGSNIAFNPATLFDPAVAPYVQKWHVKNITLKWGDHQFSLFNIQLQKEGEAFTAKLYYPHNKNTFGIVRLINEPQGQRVHVRMQIKLPFPKWGLLPSTHLNLNGWLQKDGLHLNDAQFQIGKTPFIISGALGSPQKKLQIESKAPILLETLFQSWPPTLLTALRKKATTYLQAGQINNIVLTLSFLKTFKIAGRMDLKDLTVHFIPRLPPATQVNGQATFDGSAVSIFFKSGVIKNQQLAKGSITLEKLGTSKQKFQGQFLIKGPLDDQIMQQLMNTKKPLAITNIQGQGLHQLNLSSPFGDEKSSTAIDFDIKSTLQHIAFDINTNWLPISLRKAHITIHKTPQIFTVCGTGECNKIPCQASWNQNLTSPSLSKLHVHTAVDCADKLSPLLGKFLRGGIDLSATYVPAQEQAHVVIDLTQNRLHFPFLEWQKDPAIQAKLSLTAQIQEQLMLSDIKLSAPDLEMEGDSTWTPDFKLKKARLHIQTAPQTQDITVTFIKDKHVDLQITGKHLNVRPFLAPPSLKNQGWVNKLLPETSLNIMGNVEKLSNGKKKPITAVTTHFKGEVSSTGIKWDNIAFQGKVARQHQNDRPRTISIRMDPQPADLKTLSVAVENAGHFLKFFDIYHGITKGSLSLNASQKKEGEPYIGTLSLNDFFFNKSPALAKILSLASIKGIAALFSSRPGLTFEVLKTQFSYQDHKITLKDSLITGSGLGIVLKGSIDNQAKEFDLKGNIIPAYQLGSLLNVIPLIGPLLIGDTSEGFLATAFNLKGPFEAPKIELNILSPFTPWVVKKAIEQQFGKPNP